MYPLCKHLWKSVVSTVRSLISRLLLIRFCVRTVLELAAAAFIGIASPMLAAAFAVIPLTDRFDTKWLCIILMPVVFTLCFFLIHICAELMLPLTFLGISGANDEFIRRYTERIKA